jgi:hypothetical protein
LDFELVAPDGTSFRHVNFNEPSGILFPAQEPAIQVTDRKHTHMLGEWTLYVYPAASLDGDYRVTVSFQ